MQDFNVPAANSRIEGCDVTLVYPHKQEGMYFRCSFSSEQIIEELIYIKQFWITADCI